MLSEQKQMRHECLIEISLRKQITMQGIYPYLKTQSECPSFYLASSDCPHGQSLWQGMWNNFLQYLQRGKGRE